MRAFGCEDPDPALPPPPQLRFGICRDAHPTLPPPKPPVCTPAVIMRAVGFFHQLAELQIQIHPPSKKTPSLHPGPSSDTQTLSPSRGSRERLTCGGRNRRASSETRLTPDSSRQTASELSRMRLRLHGLCQRASSNRTIHYHSVHVSVRTPFPETRVWLQLWH